MTPEAPQWSHVLEEARRLAALRGEPFDAAVFVTLGDLIRFASIRSPEPVVSLGGSDMVHLDWPGLALEVFADWIDVRRQTTPDAAFAVWREHHNPGPAFSDDFERALPKLPDWEVRRPDRR